jgi:hypothetical protein
VPDEVHRALYIEVKPPSRLTAIWELALARMIA